MSNSRDGLLARNNAHILSVLDDLIVSTTGSADEALEDAREVADAVRQVCQRMKKGKARP